LMITHDVEEAIFLSQRVYVMSRCPGQLKLEVPIALPTQRDLEMKLSPEFVEIKRQVLHALREE
jgi:NitT/TauT family transport system ATP-binding protein